MQQSERNGKRDLARQRSNARRTALGLAVIAVLIFVAFFLSGVFGKGLAA